ncbi:MULTISPECIES: lycopene cyclase family protein [Pseudonocardia]|uniref:Lycopene beta cyclase n=2 Tax=Pseudonocardia TaxID=1847 RepID=A0A1Y2MV94_PSEAH|nr:MULTISPECIES: lycopene cyclase family protein [Pseudonocardia]OSY39071.1 Lycopene beta cyclase [Pseudonocardia autotrophica]TDN71333.1 lycopene cyclase (CrtL-type) [Pseudonocardia autotrophica]BBG02007.1 putative carotenoid cyclase [Pseudonocardia autotrophica]GEC23171.1 putative carotenoid cyclase [Pseudonocardia saturnea]
MRRTEAAVDVLVLGGGPAGRALAGACAAHGLRTALADPAPDLPWSATYCAWPEELPADLPRSVLAARPRARAVLPGGGGDRDLGPYAVLDTAGLRAHLDSRLGGVTVLAGRADAGDLCPGGGRYRVSLRAPGAGSGAPGDRDRAGGVGTQGAPAAAGSSPVPAAADALVVDTALVVDATGAPSRLRPVAGPAAEQTAYGVVVPADVARPVLAPGEAVFMDWRPPGPGSAPGWTDWPTFLYAVPYGDGTVLLEETSLARRPGLPLPELRERLTARLAGLGIAVPGDAPVERVRFPVDSPRAAAHPVPFGAATPLVHPATGFSVAPALRLAPEVAAVLGRHLPADPAAAVSAATGLLWSPSARMVHQLRRHGLQTVLDLPARLVPGFFDAFFAGRSGRAFLTGREDLPGTLAGMAGVFRAAPAPVKGHMLRSAVRFRPVG